jgi:hypothetical protein
VREIQQGVEGSLGLQLTQREGGLKLHVRIRIGGALERRVGKRG